MIENHEQTEGKVIVMMSSSRVMFWSTAALLAGCLALSAMFSIAAVARGDEIDWSHAGEAWKKSLSGGQLTPPEQACLDRAKTSLAKQGLDVKRVEELAKKALAGGPLTPDEQAYLDRVRQAIRPAGGQPVKNDLPSQQFDAAFYGTDCGLGNFFGKREEIRKIWAAHFGSLKTYRTHGIGNKWTLGGLEQYKAKVIVLIAGGRQVLTEHQEPEDVAKGIAACIDQIHQRQPQAKVLVVGIPLPPVDKWALAPVGPKQELAKD